MVWLANKPSKPTKTCKKKKTRANARHSSWASRPNKRHPVTKIFDGARAEAQNLAGIYQESDKHRDAEIAKLLTPEQKAAYDKVQDQHKGRRDELGKNRDDIFARAETSFRDLLNDEQKAKYDEMMANRNQRGPGRARTRKAPSPPPPPLPHPCPPRNRRANLTNDRVDYRHDARVRRRH